VDFSCTPFASVKAFILIDLTNTGGTKSDCFGDIVAHFNRCKGLPLHFSLTICVISGNSVNYVDGAYIELQNDLI